MTENDEDSIMSDMVQQMLQNQRDESNRRGKRPGLLPPDIIRYLHRITKQSTEKEIREAGKLPLMRNTLNNKIFASKTTLSKLTLTIIPELSLEESAKGKFILVRVLEEWFSVISWNTVIEDHQGHVIRLGLYNYPLDEMFSPGDAIVIKEPYLKLALDKMPVIRCDCPTDIVVLRLTHPLHGVAKGVKWRNYIEVNDPLTALPFPSDSMQWKVRGNALFARGQLILSKEAYYFGLKLCSNNDPIAKIIQLNLLAVQLRLEYFEWVVQNGEKFMQKFPEEPKAYFRVGKAYHLLRNYEKALDTYEILCQKFPEDKIGPTEFEKAKVRIQESNGEFDFDKLRKMSLAKPFEEIDCADFCGPVKVAKIRGKGRGLVLTEDVGKGRLLVVSKALVAVLDPDQNPGVQIDPDGKAQTDRDQAASVTQLARLIMKNPTLIGAQVYDLCSGENSRKPVQHFCDPDLKKEPICDVELIKKITDCNSFKIVEIMPSGEIQFKGSGLFLLPSYINHSCIPNARAEFLNNILVVTALKDMRDGTELTVSYIPPELSYEERTELIKNRGFRCRCAKCKSRR